METKLIKDYIADFQNKKFPKIIKRELKISKIKNKAISLIGPRRSGKTYYFLSIIKKLEREKTLYLDFEESFLKELNALEVLEIILDIFPEVTGNSASYIFLDEIQNIKNWESLVRTLLNKDLEVFITGSSSKLLSKEISTQLRGRTLSYLLLPFSFREFLKARKIQYNLNLLADRGKIKRLLGEYLEGGGFPEVVLYEEREKILKEYVDMTFFKDFVERHEIKSTKLARYIFNHLMQNFSKEFSIRAIERKLRSEKLKFNITTLYKYVENLEDTVFVFFLRKFSLKAHERESWPRKIYLCDTGLTKVYRFSPEIGKLSENAVFLELLRKTNENPLLELYYWKDYQQREVDFVLKQGERVHQLIQVCYDIDDFNTKERELKSLVKASKQLNCNNLLVITWDYEAKEEFKGKTITFKPLWKWLLEI